MGWSEHEGRTWDTNLEMAGLDGGVAVAEDFWIASRGRIDWPRLSESQAHNLVLGAMQAVSLATRPSFHPRR
jgi:hypothetical protein